MRHIFLASIAYAVSERLFQKIKVLIYMCFAPGTQADILLHTNIKFISPVAPEKKAFCVLFYNASTLPSLSYDQDMKTFL